MLSSNIPKKEKWKLRKLSKFLPDLTKKFFKIVSIYFQFDFIDRIDRKKYLCNFFEKEIHWKEIQFFIFENVLLLDQIWFGGSKGGIEGTGCNLRSCVVHQLLTKGGRTSCQPLTPREIESKGPSWSHHPLYPFLTLWVSSLCLYLSTSPLQGGRKSSPRYVRYVR